MEGLFLGFAGELDVRAHLPDARDHGRDRARRVLDVGPQDLRLTFEAAEALRHEVHGARALGERSLREAGRLGDPIGGISHLAGDAP
ncbi:hypothetical protein D3C87_1863880 [compost metagenome]